MIPSTMMFEIRFMQTSPPRMPLTPALYDHVLDMPSRVEASITTISTSSRSERILSH